MTENYYTNDYYDYSDYYDNDYYDYYNYDCYCGYGIPGRLRTDYTYRKKSCLLQTPNDREISKINSLSINSLGNQMKIIPISL